MLLKLIHCQVPSHDMTHFSNGQQAWLELAKLEGFLGQPGGWLTDHPESAMILGLWRDERAYRNFMADHHDAIAESSGQKDHYQAINVTLWHTVDSTTDDCDKFTKAVSNAKSILIAQSDLLPNCEATANLFDDTLAEIFQHSTTVLAKLSLISQVNSHRKLTCVLSDCYGAECVKKRSLVNSQGLRFVKSDNNQVTLDFFLLEPSWTVGLQPSAH